MSSSEGEKKKSSGIGRLLFYMVPVVAVAGMRMRPMQSPETQMALRERV